MRFGKDKYNIIMNAEENWYISGQYEDEQDRWDEEMISLTCLKQKVKEIAIEMLPEQVLSIKPMQLITQINESLSRGSDMFGKLYNVQGFFIPGNGQLYQNGYYYDFIKDENNSSQISILVPAILRGKLKPNNLIVVSGIITKRIDTMKSLVELQIIVDTVVDVIQSDNSLAQIIKDSYKPQLDRLAFLEKTSQKDKEQIERLLYEKKNDVLVYAKERRKLEGKLEKLNYSLNNRIQIITQRTARQLLIWRSLFCLCFILLLFLFYMYGKDELWW